MHLRKLKIHFQFSSNHLQNSWKLIFKSNFAGGFFSRVPLNVQKIFGQELKVVLEKYFTFNLSFCIMRRFSQKLSISIHFHNHFWNPLIKSNEKNEKIHFISYLPSRNLKVLVNIHYIIFVLNIFSLIL